MLKSTPDDSPIEQVDSPIAVKPGLRALFEAEESALLRFAFSMVGRRSVAEELVQDAFLRLHVNEERVEEPVGWLRRCIRNQALNHLRKTKREYWLEGNASGELEQGRCEAPDEILEKLETVAELRELILELSPVDRELIELRYFDGRKYREIAESLGTTVGNVGFRLHRLVKQLASRLVERDVVNDSKARES